MTAVSEIYLHLLALTYTASRNSFSLSSCASFHGLHSFYCCSVNQNKMDICYKRETLQKKQLVFFRSIETFPPTDSTHPCFAARLPYIFASGVSSGSIDDFTGRGMLWIFGGFQPYSTTDAAGQTNGWIRGLAI